MKHVRGGGLKTILICALLAIFSACGGGGNPIDSNGVPTAFKQASAPTYNKDDLYQFFAVAFGAAPGVTYMAQLLEAANSGLSVKEIVNIFTTKPQFTDTYPLSMPNIDFATKLVASIVRSSASDLAKQEAISDVMSALALLDWTRGDVIFAIVTNLANKADTDPDWGATSRKLKNQVIYAKYYTEVMKGDTTNIDILRLVVANVTENSDTGTGIEQAIRGWITSTALRVEFRGLGFLTTDVASMATAVSGDGKVVVGIGKSATDRPQAFRWNAIDGLVSLGTLTNGISSRARAVSADGAVIVGDGDAMNASSAVFRYSVSSGLVQLTSLNNSTLCQAGGVSANGDVVVGTCVTANNAAFRWTQGSGMVSLGQLGAGSNRTSNALAVSADGLTTVGVGHPLLTGAVMWSATGVATVLGKLPGDTSAAATAVSRDGAVIVGYSTDPALHQRPFRWNSLTGMTSIAPINGQFDNSSASAVSGNGQVVVGWGSSSVGETALIWNQQQGMLGIDAMLASDYGITLPGWRLSRATGISDDGHTIVGFGINPSGQTEGWILKLP